MVLYIFSSKCQLSCTFTAHIIFKGDTYPHLKFIDSISVLLKRWARLSLHSSWALWLLHSYTSSEGKWQPTCSICYNHYLCSLTIECWCPVLSVLHLFSWYFVKRRKLLLSCNHSEDMAFFLSTQSLVIFQ